MDRNENVDMKLVNLLRLEYGIAGKNWNGSYRSETLEYIVQDIDEAKSLYNDRVKAVIAEGTGYVEAAYYVAPGWLDTETEPLDRWDGFAVEDCRTGEIWCFADVPHDRCVECVNWTNDDDLMYGDTETWE